MPKQHHVPETRSEPKPNREQRRHPEKAARPEQQPLTRDTDVHAPADVPDARAKASGHGKKTADKWNQ